VNESFESQILKLPHGRHRSPKDRKTQIGHRLLLAFQAIEQEWVWVRARDAVTDARKWCKSTQRIIQKTSLFGSAFRYPDCQFLTIRLSLSLHPDYHFRRIW